MTNLYVVVISGHFLNSSYKDEDINLVTGDIAGGFLSSSLVFAQRVCDSVNEKFEASAVVMKLTPVSLT